MSGFLIDTNVLSETSRKTPDEKVVNWLKSAGNDSLFTSVLVLAEIRFGIELLDFGKRRLELESWFEGKLLPSFHSRILPVTHAIAARWAVLSAQSQRNGKPLFIADGLIAATAFEHGLTIVTRNIRDFEGLAMKILDPWDAA